MSEIKLPVILFFMFNYRNTKKYFSFRYLQYSRDVKEQACNNAPSIDTSPHFNSNAKH